LKNKINAAGELIITSQSERTQLQNKKKTVQKFFVLLSKVLTESPVRKATSPTRKSITERLESKRKRGYIKKLRKEDTKSLNEE
jgi:ribosome-associated protein